MITIRSGGQTGVDRAALDIAIALGIQYTGWCPSGGWAEDFLTPPGILVRYPLLRETPSSEPDQRTAWNVRDSDATLILVRDGTLARSRGTNFAKRMAELVFQKLCIVANLAADESLARVVRWLKEQASAESGRVEFVLHVAGARESESPGVYLEAKQFLDALLRRL
ncbi:MAG TPA: putative molybdenum carrier protein [Pirellulales bacterium]|nr:putative molybdenum carrier protein [Pirellulales bacterium]